MTAKAPERRHLAREEDAELQVSRARGSLLYDNHGREYVDFVMGWCVGNLGWHPPALELVAKRFDCPDYVFPGYSYRPWAELAALLPRLRRAG